MFANKHAKILIALVCAVLGFMLATQFKTTERQKTINIQRAEDLSDRLKAVEKERDELSKEMEKLQAKADGNIVAVKYKEQYGLAFHPELDENDEIHKVFLKMCER